MAKQAYKYVIVGGGLAGASAIDGIRELDKDGEILLISQERQIPYHRPPLTKGLWTGKKKVEDIFVHDGMYYDEQGVTLALGRTVKRLDVAGRRLSDSQNRSYRYEKLLLATGGVPRTLEIPGGSLDGVCYFRYLDDYLALRPNAAEGAAAVVVGDGFIGTEIAAALCMNKVEVTMVFPSEHLCSKFFPPSLAEAVQEEYQRRGVRIVSQDRPASFADSGGRFVTRTDNGQEILSDMVVVGVGIAPAKGLAESAGLEMTDGVKVNQYLQTSSPDVYAAGDIANFPYQALGKSRRVEHWDNAQNQGKLAGRNMAGAGEAYEYMPYFFSDLFDMGYEAVGQLDARMEIVCDWQEENRKGVIYYLDGGMVRGVMLWNVWDKVDAARELIRHGELAGAGGVRGAIR